MSLPLPTRDQAFQFATMLQAGLPPAEALLYFVEGDDTAELAAICQKWLKSAHVRSALLQLEGRPWQELSTEERIKAALDLHYNQLATFLRTNHYADLNAGEKAKADTARTALEAKLAGSAGKVDALSAFFDDVRSGRVKLLPAQKPS